MRDRGRPKADPDSRVVKMKNREEYGLKIKQYRKQKNMTAEELADILQVTLSTVRNWECGIARPDPAFLVRMFSILDVDPNTFFGIRGVGYSLTEKERQIVDDYRAMEAGCREDFRAIGAALAERSRKIRLRKAAENIIAIPDYGVYAAAGQGDDWTQDEEEHQALLYNRGSARQADLIVTVSGSSMEPLYHDGDRVLVKKINGVQFGKIYVFNIRGRGNVIKQAEKNSLHSLNEEFSDIVPGIDEDVTVVGQVLEKITPGMIPSDEEKELYWLALEDREEEDHSQQRTWSADG